MFWTVLCTGIVYAIKLIRSTLRAVDFSPRSSKIELKCLCCVQHQGVRILSSEEPSCKPYRKAKKKKKKWPSLLPSFYTFNGIHSLSIYYSHPYMISFCLTRSRFCRCMSSQAPPASQSLPREAECATIVSVQWPICSPCRTLSNTGQHLQVVKKEINIRFGKCFWKTNRFITCWGYRIFFF